MIKGTPRFPKLLPILFCGISFLIGCKKESEPKPIGSIVGFVTLYSQSGPLQDFSGVLVKIDDTDITSSSDVNGKFKLNNVQVGTYDLTFTKQGFGFTKRFSIPFVGGSAPGAVIDAYNSNTIILGEIPSFKINDFSASIGDEYIIGTGSPSISEGYYSIFISDNSAVSKTNSKYERRGYFFDGSLADSQILPINSFPKGTKVYLLAYPTNINTIYIDRDTNKPVYTSLGTPTHVIQVTIP